MGILIIIFITLTYFTFAIIFTKHKSKKDHSYFNNWDEHFFANEALLTIISIVFIVVFAKALKSNIVTDSEKIAVKNERESIVMCLESSNLNIITLSEDITEFNTKVDKANGSSISSIDKFWYGIFIDKAYRGIERIENPN